MYTIDPTIDSIRYTTSRCISPNEELCVFYDYQPWFYLVDTTDACTEGVEGPEQGWDGLCSLGECVDGSDVITRFDAFVEGDPHQLIPEEELPFTRLKLTPDEEEEDMDSMRKGARIHEYPSIISNLSRRGGLGGRPSRSSVSSHNVEVRPPSTPITLLTDSTQMAQAGWSWHTLHGAPQAHPQERGPNEHGPCAHTRTSATAQLPRTCRATVTLRPDRATNCRVDDDFPQIEVVIMADNICAAQKVRTRTLVKRKTMLGVRSDETGRLRSASGGC